MAKIVDTRLLCVAAQLAANWKDYQEDFARFGKPFWMKWGGESLVNHMMAKYIRNDDQSIVEYLYNLDNRNKELITRYLLSKVDGWPEWAWTVTIEDE